MAERDFQDPITARIVDFLTGIGLDVRPGEIAEPTFLPGIMISHGGLLVDEAKLTYPGDLLHEAGHLALKEPGRRQRVHIDVGRNAGEEMGAIAWSYAALLHLQLDPAIVFHAGGYRGGSKALIENFTGGHYIGVPMLEWLGLAADKKSALDLGVALYPHLLKWLR
ncbi:MAG: hypothetical protein WCF84_06515, partial [Anaerolineae bacterium]